MRTLAVAELRRCGLCHGRLARHQAEALRGGVLSHGGQASPAGRRFSRQELDATQREPGLELSIDEVDLLGFDDCGLQPPLGFRGLPDAARTRAAAMLTSSRVRRFLLFRINSVARRIADRASSSLRWKRKSLRQQRFAPLRRC